MSVCVEITYVDDVFVAQIFDGRQILHKDAEELAVLLLAAGVSVDHVLIPDWRIGDAALTTGQKIAILGRMRRSCRHG